MIFSSASANCASNFAGTSPSSDSDEDVSESLPSPTSPGRRMYSRFTFSCSRCVSSRRLLCSKRSANFLLMVSTSVSFPTTFPAFEETRFAVSSEPLEEPESSDPESESEPEPEPDSSSLNIAFAAAAGGDIAHPDEGETRHRPRSRARGSSAPRAELSRGPTADERARSARARVVRTPGRRRLRRSVEIVYDYKLRKRRRRPVSQSFAWIFRRLPVSRRPVTGSRAGCRFLRLGDDTAAPSTMGLYSKGTRSKGVTKTFQKQGQANTVQRSRHEKRDAFLAKEAFMKEAMAKHLAAATAAIADATGDGSAEFARGGVAGRPDAVALSGAPSVTPEAAAAATRPKSKDAKPRAKLRATMATVPGMAMPGSMRWEGKRKAEASSKVDDDADAAKRSKAEADADKTKIGHLMKPLRGDEIDFATTVDTNVKLPKYRGSRRW